MSENPRRDIIDLSGTIVGLHRSGEAHPIPSPAGPPPRIDGLTIGAFLMSREPPHAGQMHAGGEHRPLPRRGAPGRSSDG